MDGGDVVLGVVLVDAAGTQQFVEAHELGVVAVQVGAVVFDIVFGEDYVEHGGFAEDLGGDFGLTEQVLEGAFEAGAGGEETLVGARFAEDL